MFTDGPKHVLEKKKNIIFLKQKQGSLKLQTISEMPV